MNLEESCRQNEKTLSIDRILQHENKHYVREAMKQANVDYVYQSVFEITNNCLMKLL